MIVDDRPWIAGPIVTLAVFAICCAGACLGGFSLVTGRYDQCAASRPADATMADLAGHYLDDEGAEFLLAASGRFTSRDIVVDFDQAWVTLKGPGTWTLLPHDDGFGDISLSFDAARFAMYLDVAGTRTKPWLYWYVGDADLCHIHRFDRTG